MYICLYVKSIYFIFVEIFLDDVRGVQTAQQLRLLSVSTIKNTCSCHTHT